MRSEAGRLRTVVGTSLPLLEKGKGPYSEQYGMNRCWTCRKISLFNRIAAESCKESFCLDGSYQAQLLPFLDIETLNQGRSIPVVELLRSLIGDFTISISLLAHRKEVAALAIESSSVAKGLPTPCFSIKGKPSPFFPWSRNSGSNNKASKV